LRASPWNRDGTILKVAHSVAGLFDSDFPFTKREMNYCTATAIFAGILLAPRQNTFSEPSISPSSHEEPRVCAASRRIAGRQKI
jgi:hypothetical protein